MITAGSHWGRDYTSNDGIQINNMYIFKNVLITENSNLSVLVYGYFCMCISHKFVRILLIKMNDIPVKDI